MSSGRVSCRLMRSKKKRLRLLKMQIMVRRGQQRSNL
jgi:hypothetical protein